jgi:butyrate kinase
LYRGTRRLAEEEARHDEESPALSPDLWEQLEPRLERVQRFLRENRVEVSDLRAVVGRGGLLRPLEGGVYRVNEAMLRDAREGVQGHHPANLGCALADAIARPLNLPAFVVDPVSVDESDDLAAYSGLAGVPRRTLSHALSVHACARRYAEEQGRRPGDVNVIVAHLGGGISVCPVKGGRIVDANNAVSEGPFSPTRSGGLPVQELLDLVFAEGHDRSGLRDLTTRRGGLFSYLGTSDAREVESRIAGGDEDAKRAYRAMAYQISKEIGAMATVLEGNVDAILLTGALARSGLLTDWITARVRFIAPVDISPTLEMEALADGALAALTGETATLEY